MMKVLQTLQQPLPNLHSLFKTLLLTQKNGLYGQPSWPTTLKSESLFTQEEGYITTAETMAHSPKNNNWFSSHLSIQAQSIILMFSKSHELYMAVHTIEW